MPAISVSETRRLFGETNVPDSKTNVRHRAMMRKALEVRTPEELRATFGRPRRLRTGMGLAFTSAEMGKIKTNFVHNGRLVSNETPPPDPEVQEQIRLYRAAYDTYFMSTGNNYKVRDPAARPLLQAAEQRWHDFIGPWRAAHGMPARPAWALEPLPGLDRVRVTPALPAARGSTSARRRAPVHTPASASARTPAPIRTPASSSSSAPTRTPVHFYGVIDISDDEEGLPTPRARHAARAQLPTPPPSSPARADLSQNVHAGRKRKFVDLGVVEVSDDEEEEVRPRKKARFLGCIDLTD
ncbi:hypothetical protein C8R47DRAFT_1228128 [Mycena vitilis]|nr:hypothetical protein C8R47DRAFT_1228128 [Mycena vitilis]